MRFASGVPRLRQSAACVTRARGGARCGLPGCGGLGDRAIAEVACEGAARAGSGLGAGAGSPQTRCRGFRTRRTLLPGQFAASAASAEPGEFRKFRIYREFRERRELRKLRICRVRREFRYLREYRTCRELRKHRKCRVRRERRPLLARRGCPAGPSANAAISENAEDSARRPCRPACGAIARPRMP